MLNAKKILVIRRDNIGDLVCTTPALEALRRHYPNAEIAALVNSYNAPVLLGNRNIDKLFIYQKLKHIEGLYARVCAISQRLCLILALRIWKADVAVLAKASYDRHGLNFAKLIGAKRILGFGPMNRTSVKKIPDIEVTAPDFSGVHEVEAINNLLKPLGIVDALGPLRVHPDFNKVVQIKNELKPKFRRIGLQISAREPSRRWGEENYIELIKRLLSNYKDIQILLYWSPGAASQRMHPGDDVAANQIQKTVNNDNLILFPTMSVNELINGIEACDVFVGPDGGSIHIAAGLDKKIVALFENIQEKICHWYPWGADYIIVKSQDKMGPEINKIKVDDVESSIERLLYCL